MGQYFNEINKKFGFGCMRLPMKDGEVDVAEVNSMVDIFQRMVLTTLTLHTAMQAGRARRP